MRRDLERVLVPSELPVKNLHAALETVHGDLAETCTQRDIRERLDSVPGWRAWTERLAACFGVRPLWLGPGLGIGQDGPTSRRLLVGLAVSVFRDGFVPPYEVGNPAVTEVKPAGGSASSHSLNDLPAPPHCAGFFEAVPPMAVFFACARPHPTGGAQTCVADVETILRRADPAHIRAWREHPYLYRTSQRLGRTEHPLNVLRTIDDRPFFRFRRENMIADKDGQEPLDALEKLLADPDNSWSIPLEHDEILILWNGAPHGRLPQSGPTPDDPACRRLLLRCRIQPTTGWSDHFQSG